MVATFGKRRKGKLGSFRGAEGRERKGLSNPKHTTQHGEENAMNRGGIKLEGGGGGEA